MFVPRFDTFGNAPMERRADGHFVLYSDYAAALRSQLRLPDGDEPKLKWVREPLEHIGDDLGYCWIARTPFGVFYEAWFQVPHKEGLSNFVEKARRAAFLANPNFMNAWNVTFCGHEDDTGAPSLIEDVPLAEAMLAAQNDYLLRIGACLGCGDYVPAAWKAAMGEEAIAS